MPSNACGLSSRFPDGTLPLQMKAFIHLLAEDAHRDPRNGAQLSVLVQVQTDTVHKALVLHPSNAKLLIKNSDMQLVRTPLIANLPNADNLQEGHYFALERTTPKTGQSFYYPDNTRHYAVTKTNKQVILREVIISINQNGHMDINTKASTFSSAYDAIEMIRAQQAKAFSRKLYVPSIDVVSNAHFTAFQKLLNGLSETE